MKGIKIILHHNVQRILTQKVYLFVTLGMTIIAMALAIYFTSTFEMKGRLAVVTNGNTLPVNTEDFRIQRLEEVPAKSQLVRNKYDAIIFDQGDGKFVIETIKGKYYKEMIRQALEYPEKPLPSENKRGVGTNILGFLIMLMMLEGLFFMNFFSEDKTIGTFRRIGISPVSFYSYMLAQGIFCFLIIYVPTYLLVVAVKLLLPIDIGFTLGQYAWLLGILALLSTAYSLFMTALIENADNTMMLASSIIVLTSLLSGSFYTFQHEGVMAVITTLLPQMQYVNLLKELEQGASLNKYAWEAAYVMGLSILLFLIGVRICRKRLKEGRY